jgi:hypothetical protein
MTESADQRGTVTTFSQGHNAWLELPKYPDAVAWLDVHELTLPGTGTLSMSYQTSPTADDSLFVALSGPLATIPFAPSLGVTVTPLLKDLLTVPLAHWFRWQLTVSSPSAMWDITFRLFISANCLSPRHTRQR